MSKPSGVKNRAPAPIQITAEQLLREAQERGLEDVSKAPTQFITDKEELIHYQQEKRKDFEDQLRRQRQHVGLWCRYALWEASQLDFTRARSVFERALDVDYRNPTLWLKYAEMEMKNKFINHARNLWDRAVTLHPRVDVFWYKYSYMEEMVNAIDNARAVFQRWMEWEPDDLAWAAFIKFEVRQGQIDRARALYERYVSQWPTCRAYLKYARWEESGHQRDLARRVYERSLTELHPQEKTEKLILAFARFEERCKEYERARVIYQYAITVLEDAAAVKAELAQFEKKHGNKAAIEAVLLQQKREQYEQKLSADSYNYDLWFDYSRLEEAEGDEASVRAVYRRAVACTPPLLVKKHWKRYIYLWISWAVYEELSADNVPGAREVYAHCLRVLPHKHFTFGKIWLYAAQLEVRQKDMPKARKILGQGIGMTGKANIFRGYIDLELSLGEVERCRQLYAKYIESAPQNTSAWRAFAQLEAKVGEVPRARAIYELAIGDAQMDMPEVIWKAYIDLELAEGELSNARNLYERLLARSGHVKVWVSYGRFEYESSEGDEVDDQSASATDRSRAVYSRAYAALKAAGLKEERLLLLESWRGTESDALQASRRGASREHLAAVEARFPTKIKMKRQTEDGEEEDYLDYVFPDDEKKLVGMKLLEKAMAWKKAAAEAVAGQGEGHEDEVETVLGKRPAAVEEDEEVVVDE